MKGIILAGGSGSRLRPLTNHTSKQLLPIYNKPMIYYSLSILMLAGIREICLITSPRDQKSFQELLGDGSAYGIKLHYAIQPKPSGIAQAFPIAQPYLGTEPCALVLGDNLFFGAHLCEDLARAKRLILERECGAVMMGYRVKQPQRYGVALLSSRAKATDPKALEAISHQLHDCDLHELEIEGIVEKPLEPPSDWAVTGLYFYDSTVFQRAKTLSPSLRGELEITDLNNLFIREGEGKMLPLSRGYAWLDTGTFASLIQASHYVQVMEERQNLLVASIEEIAYNQGWIDTEQLTYLASKMKNSDYGKILLEVVKRPPQSARS